MEEDTDHEDLVIQRPQSSSVLIKTDRNNIFSTFREGPGLVKDIEVLMPDLTDKNGSLIGFKSDSSIAVLENKRLIINWSDYLPEKGSQQTRKEKFLLMSHSDSQKSLTTLKEKN